MRLARVIIADAPTAQVALERDGCLYDVEVLEARFATRFSPDRLANAGDFHTRVVALGGAGLDELDARLVGGDRPTEARLAPGTFVWLAPFDGERSAYLQLDGTGSDGVPIYRLANPRSVVGHDATLSFGPDETRAEARLDVGVLLGEDLARASASDVRAAVLGYALLDDWTGLDERARAEGAGRGQASARDRVTQLGPVLLTTASAEPLADLRAQLRLDERPVFDGTLGLDLERLFADIAALSEIVELRAGDLVGAGLSLARVVAPPGARVDLVAERLGRLSARVF